MQQTPQQTSSDTTVSGLRNYALRLLRQGTGDASAEFREGQWEAIQELIVGSGRLLVVQRAGWGKSMVYFIAAKLLRELGLGCTVLVSPLLALMRNQVDAALKMGVRASTIDSNNESDWNKVLDDVKSDSVDVLLISPERFDNQWFRDEMRPVLFDRVGMFVVDEAHCISDWGHDFRLHYRGLQNVLPQLPSSLRVLATTATANLRVMQDISQVLGADTPVRRGTLALTKISMQTIRLAGQAERMAWLAENVPGIGGSGIVYALTKGDVNRVAGFLQSRGIDAHAYHSDIEHDVRQELEQRLINNEVKALVATTALGMGFDKPDLKFVIHFQTPGSPVAYYQQVGRAGRAVDGARAILLSGTEEDDINEFFISSAFPTAHEAQLVLEALNDADEGLTQRDMESRVNVPYGRIKKTLELLELESPSPVGKVGPRWFRNPYPLPTGFWERVERITRLRREEQQAMKEFVQLESGHMDFLLAQLDSEEVLPSHAATGRLPTSVSRSEIDSANLYLRRQWVPIEPRKLWPFGYRPPRNVGNSKIQSVNEIGRALSVYDDAGWGRTVTRCKYKHSHFSDELVDACVQMISATEFAVNPDWVTNVPSRSGKLLVKNFAERLAARLGLDYVESMLRNGEPEDQKLMQNSAHQARNAWDSLNVTPEVVRRGAVFLVDDIVDSRWTLTVAGYRLRELGSGPVVPITLASATKSGADA